MLCFSSTASERSLKGERGSVDKRGEREPAGISAIGGKKSAQIRSGTVSFNKSSTDGTCFEWYPMVISNSTSRGVSVIKGL